MTVDTSPANPVFADLGLAPALLTTLAELGYEQPTPIQASALPPLLAGRDLLGQAQTGTGKTAAFALPALTRLDLDRRAPQVLVLTPTRELCIQVAEAFHRYARALPGFRVLPVYGGTEFRGQLKALKHGAHVVVGTPGRLMDHMRRGTLDLSALTTVVLDEADEMLRMGFIDDVEWILEQTPSERQTALFSATLPGPVRRIASRFLRDPETVTIRSEQRTADTIEQRYWLVDGLHKLDALTRILETENYDGMLVFVRTRVETDELSRRLEARGHACAALNGDVPQSQREKIVERFKQGAFDVLVATDVAARGLDVDRISHVINYDIPHDTESYVHRVGRTGRAGRSGQAILFVARRERGMLRSIERATGRAITRMDVPSPEDVNEHRVRRFVERIGTTLAEAEDLDLFQDVLERFQHDEGVPMERIAAALASMVQGKRPLLLDPDAQPEPEPFRRSAGRNDMQRERRGQHDRPQREVRPKRRLAPDTPMDTYRLGVGHAQGVAARNIVGALTNELNLDSGAIGRITINDDHALVQLPTGMPPEVMQAFSQIWLGGQRLQVSRLDPDQAQTEPTATGERTQRPPQRHSRDPANRKLRGRPSGNGTPKRRHKRQP